MVRSEPTGGRVEGRIRTLAVRCATALLVTTGTDDTRTQVSQPPVAVSVAVPLEPEARAVVELARTTMREVCDGLREMLLADSGEIDPEMKRDGTPVTDADVEVNDRIIAAVAQRFPDHGVVSEELDTVYHGDEWAWVIDPIDGTSNFTAGLPYWSISAALTWHGRVVFGIIDAPPIDSRFEAILGEGCTRNGVPVTVRPPADFDDPTNRYIPLFLTTGTVRRARPKVRLNPRVMGSAALDIAMVADGTGAAAIGMKPKLWDIAAGSLLVTEAGGAYVTLEGAPHLPLVAGTDYHGRSAPAAAGPDEPYVRALIERLVPDDFPSPAPRG